MADSPASSKLAGTYVLGTFRGVTQDEYPKLLVGTFVRDDGSVFEERLQFSPFSPRTGEKTLPEGLAAGQRVAVQIRLDSKTYTDKATGEVRQFVAKQALAVVAL